MGVWTLTPAQALELKRFCDAPESHPNYLFEEGADEQPNSSEV